MKRPPLFALALGLALSAAPSPARADDAKSAEKMFEVEAIEDVAYYTGDDAHKTKHRLDLFLPKGHKDYPVFFFVHGGAWKSGDKNTFGVYSTIGKFYARRGIGAVVINYRLSPAVQHPEHIKDVARAFAWTHKNIGKHGGRNDAIFLCGHSAGGHLISLLAADERFLKAEGLDSKAIRGVAPISGVYRIYGTVLSDVFGKDPEARRNAGPQEHVRAGMPPFLIIYAENDLQPCGKEPSEAFCKALKDKGCAAETCEAKKCDHMRIVVCAGKVDDPIAEAILAFIKKHTPPLPDKRTSDAGPGKVKRTLDVTYLSGSKDRHQLDVFAPEGAKGRPVVLLVHGGAWMFGDKDFFGLYRNVGVALARQGVVAVMPNYRLTPWVRHPEHVKDVARAYAWARANVADHGGDPDHIILCGHSAGGHLVTLLASDETYLKDPKLGLKDEDRKALRGVIGVSGVYNVPTPEEMEKMLSGMLASLAGAADKKDMPAAANKGTGLLLNPFRMVFGDDPKRLREASPIAYVRADLPPVLLLYAETELPLLGDMAKDYGAALKKAKVDAEVMCIDRRNHNSILFDVSDDGDKVAKLILGFVDRCCR